MHYSIFKSKNALFKIFVSLTAIAIVKRVSMWKAEGNETVNDKMLVHQKMFAGNSIKHEVGVK